MKPGSLRNGLISFAVMLSLLTAIAHPFTRQLTKNDQVAFSLGAYDHALPLVIDPLVLGYSTYLGGGDNDSADGLTIDAAGNAYIVGSTSSSVGAHFPTTQAHSNRHHRVAAKAS